MKTAIPNKNDRMNRMTDRCKNITLPQASFAGGNYNCYPWKSVVMSDERSMLVMVLPRMGVFPGNRTLKL